MLAVAQVVAMVALSPLLVGVMRQVRARLEGRVGAGVLQPWRDLRKLLGKEPLQAAGTGWVSVAGPTVLIVSSLLVCAMTPLVGTAHVHQRARRPVRRRVGAADRHGRAGAGRAGCRAPRSAAWVRAGT